MRDWREMCLERFGAAKSAEDLFVEVSNIVRQFEFEHCAYGICAPLPVSKPRFSIFSDYPEPWVRHYLSQHYFAIDPTVRHGFSTTQPLVWTSSGHDRNNEFWAEADHYGLRHGWCMSAQSASGARGLLTMVRSGSAIGRAELAENEGRMSWLANAVHVVMSQYLTPRLMPEAGVSLTNREQDSLKWSATGKTNSEIGEILSVDERTVKFHLGNAMRKLNAANKTEAVVKAALMGKLF
ncbi:autoinducer binding domain-containing protein [Cupriavidus consociatus]|uniref:autoinducer binding domain-containing protein n=1 Tax=Cupriavidus consociatus TaxID=2821357 RepID=UPI001AE3D275|nr:MULTISPECIES: autoinducer binding domain-containing protein [unclassified Cupriavidus]MBP0624087.1 autoinducer binding domain-containing protein [Cupriavidus sp. LEh25]MDK2660796.1 autoinducer binding domain-containing protein [Cupriavidus sp. LEh21]